MTARAADDRPPDAGQHLGPLAAVAERRSWSLSSLEAFGVTYRDGRHGPELAYPVPGEDGVWTRTKRLAPTAPTKYHTPRGCKLAGLYGLTQATAMLRLQRAGAAPLTLLFVNGEPSVWQAHAAGIAAVSVLGERAPRTAELDTLRQAVDGVEANTGRSVRVLVAFDADAAGRKAGPKAAAALVAARFEACALDLSAADLPEHGDIDDLAGRVGAALLDVLDRLPRLELPKPEERPAPRTPSAPIADDVMGRRLTALRASLIDPVATLSGGRHSAVGERGHALGGYRHLSSGASDWTHEALAADLADAAAQAGGGKPRKTYYRTALGAIRRGERQPLELEDRPLPMSIVSSERRPAAVSADDVEAALEWLNSDEAREMFGRSHTSVFLVARVLLGFATRFGPIVGPGYSRVRIETGLGSGTVSRAVGKLDDAGLISLNEAANAKESRAARWDVGPLLERGKGFPTKWNREYRRGTTTTAPSPDGTSIPCSTSSESINTARSRVRPLAPARHNAAIHPATVRRFEGGARDPFHLNRCLSLTEAEADRVYQARARAEAEGGATARVLEAITDSWRRGWTRIARDAGVTVAEAQRIADELGAAVLILEPETIDPDKPLPKQWAKLAHEAQDATHASVTARGATGARVLAAFQRLGSGSVEEAAALAGCRPRTVRRHIAAAVEGGALVEVGSRATTGRPATIYAPAIENLTGADGEVATAHRRRIEADVEAARRRWRREQRGNLEVMEGGRRRAASGARMALVAKPRAVARIQRDRADDEAHEVLDFGPDGPVEVVAQPAAPAAAGTSESTPVRPPALAPPAPPTGPPRRVCECGHEGSRHVCQRCGKVLSGRPTAIAERAA